VAGRRTQQAEEPAEVVLTEPAAVRALAHPARLAVIDALYAGEVLTATECAERAGVTPSAMSYHLRALEKAGIVVRAEGRGDGRERPWKRAGVDLRVDLGRGTDTAANPASLAAAELLVAQSLELDGQRLLRSLRADAALPAGEGHGSTYNRDQILITREEMREVISQVDAVLAPYRKVNRADPPGGSRLFAAAFILAQDDASS
jgi:DNA-binding transcriptional ArsR family regulator